MEIVFIIVLIILSVILCIFLKKVFTLKKTISDIHTDLLKTYMCQISYIESYLVDLEDEIDGVNDFLRSKFSDIVITDTQNEEH